MLDSSRLDKRQVAKTLDTVSAVGLVPGCGGILDG
jgi:hypothetical protein